MNTNDKNTRSYQLLEQDEKAVINVCVGSACHLKGSYEVINEFKSQIIKQKLDKHVVLKGAFCLNNCTNAVSFREDKSEISKISPEEVETFLTELKEVKGWNI